MISKGSWVALATCSAESPIVSKRCDCGQQLQKAMQMIDEAGKGVVVYMQQEGRGIRCV